MSHSAANPSFSLLDSMRGSSSPGPFTPGAEFTHLPNRDLFLPAEPKSLKESGLSPVEVEALILKQLYSSGASTGRRIAEQIRLPFPLVQEALRDLKQQLLLSYKNAAAMGDYDHELTESGTLRAKWHLERCTYCGSAPVSFADYTHSVHAQSVRKCKPKMTDIAAALSELSIPPALISSIGQAVRAGKGMFIHGQPGNGKTSIAERLIRSVGSCIWIPRTITIGGEIVRLFDPSNHEEAPLSVSQNLMSDSTLDRRWVRIKRPAIVVGGELTFQQLELSPNKQTGIIEAPVQMKANCGALVVDDFGRQRISTTELLNRIR